MACGRDLHDAHFNQGQLPSITFIELSLSTDIISVTREERRGGERSLREEEMRGRRPAKPSEQPWKPNHIWSDPWCGPFCFLHFLNYPPLLFLFSISVCSSQLSCICNAIAVCIYQSPIFFQGYSSKYIKYLGSFTGNGRDHLGTALL